MKRTISLAKSFDNIYSFINIINSYLYLIYGYIIGIMFYVFEMLDISQFDSKDLFASSLGLMGVITVIYTIINPLLTRLLQRNKSKFLEYIDSIKNNYSSYEENEYNYKCRRIKNNYNIYHLTVIYFFASLITFIIAVFLMFLKIDEKVKCAFLFGNILIQLMFFYLSILLFLKLNWTSIFKLNREFKEIKNELEHANTNSPTSQNITIPITNYTSQQGSTTPQSNLLPNNNASGASVSFSTENSNNQNDLGEATNG